jgi:hypothetical protein
MVFRAGNVKSGHLGEEKSKIVTWSHNEEEFRKPSLPQNPEGCDGFLLFKLKFSSCRWADVHEQCEPQRINEGFISVFEPFVPLAVCFH